MHRLPFLIRARPSAASSVAGAAAWPAAIWALLGMTFVLRGVGFAYPFLPYLLHYRGLPDNAAGQILAAFGVGLLAGSLICGTLSDRLGRRPVLIGALLLSAVLLPGLCVVPPRLMLTAAAFLAGCVYDASRPIVTAAIADLVTAEQAASINAWRHFALNIGAAAAGGLGGLLAGAAGYTALIGVNAAACLIVAGVVWRYPSTLPDHCRQGSEPHVPTGTSPQPSLTRALRDVRLVLLWAASVAALTCANSLFAALPMLMTRQHLPASAYGLTQTANAAAVLILSPACNAYLTRRATRPAPMSGLLAAGSLALGLGMGSAGLAGSTLGFSVSAVLAVPGEIVVVVAAADILTRIAPADLRGTYAGIWGTALGGSVVLAPLLASAALTHGGGPSTAAAITCTGALGATLCLPLTTACRRARHP